MGHLFVLLHGLAGQPEQWQWLEAELKGRGHDTHVPSLSAATWDEQIAVVAERAAGAIVVGHSLGGVAVRGFAARHPGMAAGLATIGSPTADYVPGWFREVGSVDDDRIYRVTDLERFLALAFPDGPPELRSFRWEQQLAAPPAPSGSPDGPEPRLAIVCEDDAAVEYDNQMQAAKGWPAPIASVPGGHSPHVRHPALVATLLLNWLTPEGA